MLNNLPKYSCFDALCAVVFFAHAMNAVLKSSSAELEAGADVMARSENGITPLHPAAGFGSTETFKLL